MRLIADFRFAGSRIVDRAIPAKFLGAFWKWTRVRVDPSLPFIKVFEHPTKEFPER